MKIKFIPTAQQVVTVAVCWLIISILLYVLPIPEKYKAYFRI